MANKYIIHGAAFNGNGTSSALATVDGGVGAWNSILYFDGTTPAFGTLVAGDTVYIRSKDAAGVDITSAYSAAPSFGSAVATEAAHVTWVIDNGVVWPGVSGVVTILLTSTGASTVATLRSYNAFLASNYNLIFLSSDLNYGVNLYSKYVITRDIKFDTSSATYRSATFRPYGGVHTNLWIRQGAPYVAIVGSASSGGTASTTTFYSPRIELTRVAGTTPIFKASTYQVVQTMTVYGGEVIGTGVAEGTPIASGNGFGSVINLFGFRYPRIMLLAIPNSSAAYQSDIYTSIGADGLSSSEFSSSFFSYSTRADGFFPTLNSVTEDNLYWSYAIRPHKTSASQPATVSAIKTYTQAAAVKTVTCNFLWPQGTTISQAVPTHDVVYIVCQYTDTTGALVTETSMDTAGTAISEVSANWSSLTYGPTLFKSYAVSVTTRSSVVQNSNILVTFFSAPSGVNTNDLVIFDPEPVLT